MPSRVRLHATDAPDVDLGRIAALFDDVIGPGVVTTSDLEAATWNADQAVLAVRSRSGRVIAAAIVTARTDVAADLGDLAPHHAGVPGRIDLVAVATHWRGHGIARHLLHEAARWLIDEGCTYAYAAAPMPDAVTTTLAFEPAGELAAAPTWPHATCTIHAPGELTSCRCRSTIVTIDLTAIQRHQTASPDVVA